MSNLQLLNETVGRFLLNDATQAWVVERAGADLFLVDVDADGLTGPLTHVFSVTAGDVVHGIGDVQWKGSTVTLLCQLHADATQREIDPRNEDHLHQWAARIAKELGAEGAAGPQDLETLHRNALEIFAHRRETLEQNEALRLRAKGDGQSATMSRALQQLSAVLDSGAHATLLPTQTASPIHAACSVLGREFGVQMKTPKNFVPSSDPIRDAIRIADATAVRYRSVSLTGDWWKHDTGPLLAFRGPEDGSAPPVPLALIRRKGGYSVYDSAHRTFTPITASRAAGIGPTAIMFYRSFPSRSLTWKDLLLFGLFDTWQDGILLVGIGALTGLLALVAPVATGILFDTIIPSAQRSQLYQMAALLFTTNIVIFLISLTSGAAMQRMEGRMEASIQSAVWDRMLSLPARFFKDYNSGDLVERSLSIGQIRKMLTSTALSSIMSGIFSIFSFFLLFRYSSTLALVATVMVFVTAIFSAVCGYLQMKYQRVMYQVAGKISGLTLEVMTGISKLRMSGTESQAFARWAAEFTKQKMVGARAARVSISMSMFSAVFPSVAGIAIFYFGLHSMESGVGLTPGGFVAFSAAFGQFLGASLGFANAAIGIIGIVPAYERALPIMQAIPEMNASGVDPGILTGAIEANRISFRYKEDLPLVLNDISLEIKAGEFVAFVGHSGSGKSTLFRLLLGFEKPESGFIHYDGFALEDIDPQSLRRQMGVVLQNGRVFNGDIFTNIIGSSPLTIEDAWSAARASGLDKDIEAMPMGMHTIISEGGGGLSGGQRQRLLIARAIVHRPRLLLFDEATSALDNQTQAIVSRSLEALKTTRIVIAHRLSTILNADQIFVFDKGRIVQRGTYSELIGQDGLFRDLALRQIV